MLSEQPVVREIKRMLAAHVSRERIAKLAGVGHGKVRDVALGRPINSRKPKPQSEAMHRSSFQKKCPGCGAFLAVDNCLACHLRELKEMGF